MKYKLTAKPPSLFDGPSMRKTAKSALADMIETKIMRMYDALTNCVVMDGGFLLHKVVWPNSYSYQVVQSAYVSYAITNYSEGAAVVFDGYEGHLLQRRRNRIAGVSSSKTLSVVFDLNLVVSTSQSDFLSNLRNKAMLIKVLSQQLQSHGLTVLQACCRCRCFDCNDCS